jgi:hypothetical protein
MVISEGERGYLGVRKVNLYKILSIKVKISVRHYCARVVRSRTYNI